METVSGLVRFWPETASAYAGELDSLLIWFSVLLAVLVVPVFVGLAWFAIHYRAGAEVDRRPRATGNWKLEVGWMVVPFLLSLFFFFWAASLYVRLNEPPADALQIDVIAKQWMWKAQHPGGQREIDRLHVPVGEPVRLTMISQDVIHSFYVPALRVKQDVLPDRYTSLWFEIDRPGRYALRCAEFCGTAHSRMTGEVVALPAEAYQAWLERAETPLGLAERGERLFRSFGCSGCHGAAGPVRAPRLEGVFGRPVPLAGGGTVIADARYVRDSILFPRRHVVAGFEPIMPSFRGQIEEDEILQIVAYIQSLRWGAADEPTPLGEAEPAPEQTPPWAEDLP